MKKSVPLFIVPLHGQAGVADKQQTWRKVWKMWYLVLPNFAGLPVLKGLAVLIFHYN